MVRIIPIAVLFGMTMILPACRPKAAGADVAESRRAPIEVSVISPSTTEFVRTARVTGTLFGDDAVVLSAKVAGRVVEVTRDLGDIVKPGEFLLKIDPTDYELALAERERAFRQSLAVLGLEKLPEGDFDVDKMPSVEAAKLEAKNALARFERGKQSFEMTPPVISVEDFTDLKTTWEVAEAQIRRERMSMNARLAEARTLEAQKKTAEQRLRDTQIFAPGSAAGGSGGDSYEISERMAANGAFVQAGTALFKLIDADPIKLKSPVPARYVDAIKIGQTAQIEVVSTGQKAIGTVHRISPEMDSASRTFQIEILVPNSGRNLKPGLFAVAHVETAKVNVLAVPERALINFAGVDKVVAVEKGKASEKRVELGDRQKGMVEIMSGLKAAEAIVAEPTNSIVNGQDLTIVDAPTKEAKDAKTR